MQLPAFFFSSRRRHTRLQGDWSSDVCSSDLFLTDATKLRTILRNLIINAAKFTAAGTVALRIVQRGGALRLEIRDTGPRIRPQDHELIFEPFPQLDGSAPPPHRGGRLGPAPSPPLAPL